MPKTRNNGLTLKQQAFVRNLTNKEKRYNQGEAARLAGYSPKSADSIGSQLLTKTKIIKALEDKGLTDDFLVDSIKQNITEGTGIKATADTATKNIELALKLKGYLGKETEATTNNTQNNYILELHNLPDDELQRKLEALQEVVASNNTGK